METSCHDFWEHGQQICNKDAVRLQAPKHNEETNTMNVVKYHYIFTLVYLYTMKHNGWWLSPS